MLRPVWVKKELVDLFWGEDAAAVIPPVGAGSSAAEGSGSPDAGAGSSAARDSESSGAADPAVVTSAGAASSTGGSDMLGLIRAEQQRSQKKTAQKAKKKPSGVYSAVDAAWWISTPGRINCKYMGGSQAGKRRDVSVLEVYPCDMLKVADSSEGTKTYRLDRVQDARMVPLNADSFTPEDRMPSIRFDDGIHLQMKDPSRLQAVLEEFVGQDPLARYPFAADKRRDIAEFLEGRAKE